MCHVSRTVQGGYFQSNQSVSSLHNQRSEDGLFSRAFAVWALCFQTRSDLVLKQAVIFETVAGVATLTCFYGLVAHHASFKRKNGVLGLNRESRDLNAIQPLWEDFDRSAPEERGSTNTCRCI